MGTDELGRDTFSRIVFGARVSLQVGIISVFIALLIGAVFGIAAGFLQGRLDSWLMRGVDIMFAFPGLVLAIVIAGLLGASRTNAMIAIGLVYAPAFARVIRGSVLLGHERAVRRGGARGRVNERPSDSPVRHAEHRCSADRDDQRLSVERDPDRSRSELPRSRHAAAGAGLGRDAERGAHLHGDLALDGDLPGLAIMIVVLGFNFLGTGCGTCSIRACAAS